MTDLGNKDVMAANINRLMDKMGIDRNTLSEEIGVKYTTLSDWINGKTYPRIDKIEKLANFFQVSKSELIERHVEHSLSDARFSTYRYINIGSFPELLINENVEVKDGLRVALSDNMLGQYAGDEDVFITHIYGESMNRVLPAGAMVAVKKYKDLKGLADGDIVLFNDGDREMNIKRFYNDPSSKVVTFDPDSINTNYSPMSYRYEDIEKINIYGKIIYYGVSL